MGKEWERFVPGESPFRKKGVSYQGELEHYDRYFPGGREALFASVRDPRLVAFMRQSFLAGGWYDVIPSLVMAEHACTLMGKPYLEFLRDFARLQAERDIRGVYRMLLKLVSPDTVMERLPKVANQYFDFVRSEARKTGPGRWESVVFGLPSFYAAPYMAVAEAFIVYTLEQAGARNVKHRWMGQEPDGTRAGVPLLKVTRQLNWDP